MFLCLSAFSQSRQSPHAEKAAKTVIDFYAAANEVAKYEQNSDEYFQSRSRAHSLVTDYSSSNQYSKEGSALSQSISSIEEKGGIAQHKILNVGSLQSSNPDGNVSYGSECRSSRIKGRPKNDEIIAQCLNITPGLMFPVTHEIRFNDGSRSTLTSYVVLRNDYFPVTSLLSRVSFTGDDEPSKVHISSMLITRVLISVFGTDDPDRLLETLREKDWDDIFGGNQQKHLDLLRQQLDAFEHQDKLIWELSLVSSEEH